MSRIAMLALAAATLAACAVPPGAATVDGPCQAVVGGTDASPAGARAHSGADGTLPYTITSASPTVRWVVDAEYGPFTFRVHEREFADDGATVRSDVASAKPIQRYGGGVYRVHGVATLADGTTCDVRMLLELPGSPLRSAVGLAAAGLLGVGGALLLATVVRISLDVLDAVGSVRQFCAEALAGRRNARAAVADASPAAPARAVGTPGPGAVPHDAGADEAVETEGQALDPAPPRAPRLT